jgi:hypothetical protein
MNTLQLTLIAIAAGAISACGGGGGGAPDASVALYRYLGSVQCTGGGVSLSALERQLQDAGIGVLAASCGADGNAYAALCGAPDGRIGILEVPEDKAALAATLGFAPLANLPAAVRLPCG